MIPLYFDSPLSALINSLCDCLKLRIKRREGRLSETFTYSGDQFVLKTKNLNVKIMGRFQDFSKEAERYFLQRRRSVRICIALDMRWFALFRHLIMASQILNCQNVQCSVRIYSTVYSHFRTHKFALHWRQCLQQFVF